ncbi:MAG: hypothetical protein IKS35_05310 [Clostridia bacterium]|nr:hypothetical protein [Clostridia bacterium]
MDDPRIESIVKKLKEMVDENGPNYLAEQPFRVYSELVSSEITDRQTAAAVLHLLASGLLERVGQCQTLEELSKSIQSECNLNKRMADRLASILHLLYSQENKKEWCHKEREGLAQFLNEDFLCEWKGFAVWDEGNGTVNCHYEAKIILKPTKEISKDKELVQQLTKNPFLTKKKICDLFEKRLRNFLDDEFEDYCTAEDYYQPVVEDFGDNLEYDLKKWCEQTGFEIVSCDGDGDDEGYEPKIKRGWY